MDVSIARRIKCGFLKSDGWRDVVVSKILNIFYLRSNSIWFEPDLTNSFQDQLCMAGVGRRSIGRFGLCKFLMPFS